DVLAQRGAAAAEYDQVRGKLEVEDVRGGEEAVLLAAGAIDEREHHARQLGLLRVGKTVGREMHEAVLGQVGAGGRLPAGVEADGLLALFRLHEGEDGPRLTSGEGEAHAPRAQPRLLRRADRAPLAARILRDLRGGGLRSRRSTPNPFVLLLEDR